MLEFGKYNVVGFTDKPSKMSEQANKFDVI